MAHKRPRPTKPEVFRFHLDDTELNRLAKLAEAESLSMSAVLRRLIRAAKLPKPLDA